jgi:hypothetical protein
MPLRSDLPSVGYEKNPPDPAGTASIFSRVGHALDEAVADLIDNSVDAGATKVLIRFIRDQRGVKRIVIADNGRGMRESELKRAMQYGVQSPHRKTDLGKYGIGLKAASFSQCRSLSVLSRSNGSVSGRRWTLASIKKEWRLEIVDPIAARQLLDGPWSKLSLKKHGTLVVWDDLESLGLEGLEASEALGRYMKSVPIGLGLRFHRYLESGKLSIELDVLDERAREIGAPVFAAPLNPFGYDTTGRKGFPIPFKVDMPELGELTLTAHIWPRRSNLPNYKLGGGKVAERQGFYFYRNDRLIQAGGWNGVRGDSEPHASLARVAIDLPPDFDSAFNLSIQKSRIIPPPTFVTAVQEAVSGRTSFQDYVETAIEVYRQRGERAAEQVLVPFHGFPVVVRERIAKNTPRSAQRRKISFVWAKLDRELVFDADRERDEIVLNALYRDKITGGYSSGADVPLIKSLLLLLLWNEFGRQRVGEARRDWLAHCNEVLLEVIKQL